MSTYSIVIFVESRLQKIQMTEKQILELLAAWENIPLLTKELAAKPADFDVLVKTALYSADAKSWRAAYIVDLIHDNHPELLLPYLNEMILQLKEEKNNGKKRHFLKLISQNKPGEEHHGFLFDYCLNAFTSAKEAIAVRVNAMQILYNITETEPGLKPEILAIIEHEMEYHATAGILSRGRKLAAKLHAQIQ